MCQWLRTRWLCIPRLPATQNDYSMNVAIQQKEKKRKKGDPFTFNVPNAWDYPIIKTNENPVYVEEVNGVDKHTQKWDIIRSTNRNSSIFPFNWWWVGQITTPQSLGLRVFSSRSPPRQSSAAFKWSTTGDFLAVRLSLSGSFLKIM